VQKNAQKPPVQLTAVAGVKFSRHFMRILFLIIFFIFLAGCSARGTIYQEAALPIEGYGQVYVSREDAFFGSSADVNLLINSELKAKLSNNGYTVLDLPVGEYRLTQEWSSSMASLIHNDSNTIEIAVENKKLSYAIIKMVSCASFERGELCYKPKIASAEKAEITSILSANKYQPVFNERELRYENCWFGWHPLFRYWC
jgi:hypothetical protein